MIATVTQVKVGIRVLLRRPGEPQLADQDILEQIQDELHGLVQDMDMGDREHRTASGYLEVRPDADNVDLHVSLPNIPDFEPLSLEYGTTSGGVYTPYAEATLVDFRNFAHQAAQGVPVASFYSSSSMAGGLKLRTNLSNEQAIGTQWRVSYRVPLLSIVQTGSKPPIPTNFIPMVKLGGAIRCMPLVKNDTPEWRVWKNDTLPRYEAQYRVWNNPGDLLRPGRWQTYLDSSVGPQIQRLPRFDDHRRRGFSGTRGYVPRGRPS